jgi:hypothetical protein
MTDDHLYRPSIEYSLVEHCNLSCYGCDHASPLLKPRFTELDVFVADLAALRPVLRVDTLYLIGGEPLLHPRLLDFVTEGIGSGVALGVSITTNGVLLHQMPDAVWRLIAGLDVTCYPGVTIRMSQEELEAKARRFGVALRIRTRETFRHTILHTPMPDPELIGQVYRACRIAHDYGCHAVCAGRYFKCSVAPYLPRRLALDATFLQRWASDSVPLHDNPRLRQDLARYLASASPLASCDYCLGTSGTDVAHHQLNAEGRDAWRRECHSDARALIDPERLEPVIPGAAPPAARSWRFPLAWWPSVERRDTTASR